MKSVLQYVNYSLSVGLFVWILLGLFAVEVSGYTDGADTSLCVNMTPSNDSPQDNSASPYRIEFVDMNTYYSNDPLRSKSMISKMFHKMKKIKMCQYVEL